MWKRFAAALVCTWVSTCASLCAQSTATLRGEIVDSQGSAVAGALVSLQNPMTGLSLQASTADDGSFQITNIPYQTYSLSAAKPGFTPWAQQLPLRTNVPQHVKVQFRIADQITHVEVNASETTALVDPEGTG